MGNVALEVGETDRKITAWLRAYFEADIEKFGKKMALNQTELARAIPMSEARMSRRMSGQLPWLPADLDRIADFLGVDVSEIVEGPK